MIRFINIDNGRVYNGDAPYVHWFDDQQSIDLIYVKRLCVMSDSEFLHVSMPDNPVFRLLDVSKICDGNTIEMNQIKYQDLATMYCNELNIEGVQYDNYYIYMIYVVGSSDTAIEARQEFTINDETFIVGADFYEEREELKINLGNFGIELPESVQRAIYPSNVHEEAKDNILLNRKYKELLMDYIDVLGNKGSYSSLINSLHWFEYGDLLTIKEFWKHKEWERIIYNDQEFTQILTNRAKHMLTNFVKTTYIGIYLAMQQEVHSKDGDGSIQYDKEIYPEYAKYDMIYNATLDKSLPQGLVSSQGTDKDTLSQVGVGTAYVTDHPDEHTDMAGANWRRYSEYYSTQERLLAEPVPALENVAYMWSRTELSIKMALLGNFYETYFMPIHLDLIHATIEDLVYTNAIKVIPLGYMSRTDHFESLSDIDCNIKNGQTFLLGDVTANVNKETVFYTPWTDCRTIDPATEQEIYDYDIHQTFGVDEVNPKSDAFGDDEDVLKNFMVNYYEGPGVIVPFEFVIAANEGDFIHKSIISIKDNDEDKWITRTFSKVFAVESDDPADPDGPKHIHIKFNLLFTKDHKYDILVQFVGADSQTYFKKVTFEVIDTRRVGLTVYRLKAIPEGQTFENVQNWRKREAGNHIFTHTLIDIKKFDPENIQAYYTQFVPSYIKGHGARLNNVLVLVGKVQIGDQLVDFMEYLSEHGGYEVCDYLRYNYYEFPRKYFTLNNRIDAKNGVSLTDDVKYYVFISKSYDFVLDPEYIVLINQLNPVKSQPVIIRNDQVFIPQFHYLEPISPNTLDDFKIARDETICVVPDINFLERISSYEWIFHNASRLEDIELNSIKEPIVAYTDKRKPLDTGYYDVIFRYKLVDRPDGDETIHEVMLKSAFIQTDEIRED